MTTNEKALLMHEKWNGKLETVSKTPVKTREDLAIAYTPGVAEPCKVIAQDKEAAYKYTMKANTVAVVSDGSAVLGLGNIGPYAAMPVMEGKAVLFKEFGNVNAVPICLDTQDTEEIIKAVTYLAPGFGGINLEDISAPRCFEIEERLKEILDIPVFHDDQHGTAIVVLAGVINALKVVGKKKEDCRVVVNGAGSAGVAITKLLLTYGFPNIIMCDKVGIVSRDTEGLNWMQKKMTEVTNLNNETGSLADALKGADIFIGVSAPNIVTPKMVASMNRDSILFAMANPIPEIMPDVAKAAGARVVGTGRSDFPNQVNNVVAFPGIFKGALEGRATQITEEMKLAATYAIAKLTKEPVPDVVNSAYGIKRLSFGPEYIIPKALDPRLLTAVAPAVAKAAMDSGVAQHHITDWDAYNDRLKKLMGYDNKMLREFTEMARKEPKRVVFAEANHANMLQAASTAMKEGICKPILLGNDELIGKLAESIGVDLSGMQIINLRHPNEEDRRIRYAQLLTEKRQREGMTYAEAHEKMFDRNYFGMMMVEAGEADAFITGTYSKYAETIQIAKEVIGIREGYKHFGAMHIMNTKCGTYFLADTLINRKPTTETLIDIAKLSYDSVRFFAKDPVIAMVSYSNFGSDNQGSPLRVHEAIKILHEQYPEIIIDGEMQMNFALNNKLRDKSYPFNKLKGREVNTIVFPNLSSANSAYKMMLEMGVAESIGPIQMGLNKPIHFTDIASSTRDIVNLTTVAVLDAIVQERRNKQ